MISNQRSFMGTRVLVTAVPSLPGTLETAEDRTVQVMTKDLSQPAFVGTAEGCSGRWAASIPAREGIGGTRMCQVDFRGKRHTGKAVDTAGALVALRAAHFVTKQRT